MAASKSIPLYRLTAARNLHALAAGAAAIELLSASAIGTVVLKGGALLDHYYRVDERPMADVDILIDRADFSAALGALSKAGWHREMPPGRPLAGRTHHSGAFRSEDGGFVDIHTHLSHPVRWRIDHRALIMRAVPTTVADVATRRLSNEDFVLHLAINQAKDLYSTDGRVAEDISRFVAVERLEWWLLAERARRWRCTVALWLTLSHAKAYGSADIPQEVLEEVRPRLPRRDYLRMLIRPAERTPYRFGAHTRPMRQALVAAPVTDSFLRFGVAAASVVSKRIIDRVLQLRSPTP